MALVPKGNKVMMRVVPGARFFVPETKYNQRRITLLKNATFVAKYNLRLIHGFDFNEKSIIEFRIKNEAANMTIWDFSLPFFMIKGRGLYLTDLDFMRRCPMTI